MKIFIIDVKIGTSAVGTRMDNMIGAKIVTKILSKIICVMHVSLLPPSEKTTADDEAEVGEMTHNITLRANKLPNVIFAIKYNPKIKIK